MRGEKRSQGWWVRDWRETNLGLHVAPPLLVAGSVSTARGERLEGLHSGGTTKPYRSAQCRFLQKPCSITISIANANARLKWSRTKKDLRSEGARSHSTSVTLAIHLLMIPLNLFLINIGVIFVQVADKRQGRAEEGWVLVTVRVVLVGGADGGVRVDYIYELIE